jgi:hypothetical protein
MTASKIYILLYGRGYPGLRSEKSGLLEMKERVTTLVFQPHCHIYFELLWGTMYLQPL